MTTIAARLVRRVRVAAMMFGLRHHAVGVRVVLVHADAIEAALLGELELIQVFVVDLRCRARG